MPPYRISECKESVQFRSGKWREEIVSLFNLPISPLWYRYSLIFFLRFETENGIRQKETSFQNGLERVVRGSYSYVGKNIILWNLSVRQHRKIQNRFNLKVLMASHIQWITLLIEMVIGRTDLIYLSSPMRLLIWWINNLSQPQHYRLHQLHRQLFRLPTGHSDGDFMRSANIC